MATRNQKKEGNGMFDMEELEQDIRTKKFMAQIAASHQEAWDILLDYSFDVELIESLNRYAEDVTVVFQKALALETDPKRILNLRDLYMFCVDLPFTK